MKINFKQIFIALGVSMFASAVVAQDQNNNGQQTMDAIPPVTAQHFVWEAAIIDMQEIQMGELALQKSDNAGVKTFAEHMIASHKKACEKLKVIAQAEGLKFPNTNSLSMKTTDHGNGSSDWNSNTGMDTNRYATTEMERGGHVATNSTGSMMTNSSVDPDVSMDSNTDATTEMPRGQGSVQNTPTNANNTMDTNTYLTTDMARGQRLATNMDNDMGERSMNLGMLSGVAFDQAYAKKMVMGHQRAIRKFETASIDLTDAELKSFAQETLPHLRTHLRLAEELQAKVGMLTDSGMTNSTSMNQSK